MPQSHTADQPMESWEKHRTLTVTRHQGDN